MDEKAKIIARVERTIKFGSSEEKKECSEQLEDLLKSAYLAFELFNDILGTLDRRGSSASAGVQLTPAEIEKQVKVAEENTERWAGKCMLYLDCKSALDESIKAIDDKGCSSPVSGSEQIFPAVVDEESSDTSSSNSSPLSPSSTSSYKTDNNNYFIFSKFPENCDGNECTRNNYNEPINQTI